MKQRRDGRHDGTGARDAGAADRSGGRAHCADVARTTGGRPRTEAASAGGRGAGRVSFDLLD